MADASIRSNPEKLLRQIMARFVAQEVVPRAAEIDQAAVFPRELFRKLAAMGMYGIRYPKKEKEGGGGNSTLYCIMVEELSKGLVSLAAIAAKQCLMATNFLQRFGTPELKEAYLVPALRGEMVGSFCLTEPEAASDLGGVRTRAIQDGEDWIIQGSKTWITNAPVADFFTVLAQTDPDKGIRGLNFFFVPKDTPGVKVGPKFDTLGTRSTEIAEVAFNGCRIPGHHLLGVPGKGLKALLSILAEIRAMTGALALGLAKAAYEASFKYGQERAQFGKTINKYQLIQAKIADMATEIWAAELMLKETCAMIDRGQECNQQSAMLKYYACEVACKCCDHATRIMASYSYAMEYPVQRFYRDSRFLLYGGGTHEILLTNIARMAGF